MKKFVASALVAGAFVAATPAMAATTISLTQGMDGTYSGTTGSVTPMVGAFNDAYEFAVPTAGSVSASVISLSITGGLQLMSGSLNGTALTLSKVSDYVYTLTLPTAGIPSIANPQKLLISGNSQGGGSYTANVSFAAVPEPATWALMILGFGVVGYSMRRRPAVRFSQAI
ncbi:FxDxF family PEP-CTERM protein [Sphingomonas sp. RHCKR7]|uniref:FxDxF family PEP-CTERM protein n=1 Tax=Sphingomonas folli TaxID=2862497 RepID=UPI001CA4EDD2|nr:FxDxF family PEP-CTERM protein [Sphingomonas folli]MBW6526686.1 FxDxF family PEP-CTERM protein [Sphingomonas folli]